MRQILRNINLEGAGPLHIWGAPVPKPILGTLIGTGLGVASSIIGGAQSEKQMREARRLQARQHEMDEAWYKRRYNENYADTAAGQSLITRAKDFANENWKKAQGASAVGGATDASVAMAKEAGNKVIADTLNNMAANDVARKDNIDNIKMRNDQNYTNSQVAMAQQNAANISSAAGRASDALMGAGAAFDGFDSGSTASNVKKNAQIP